MRRSLNFALQHGRIYEKRKYMINAELCDAIGLVALRLFEFNFDKHYFHSACFFRCCLVVADFCFQLFSVVKLCVFFRVLHSLPLTVFFCDEI